MFIRLCCISYLVVKHDEIGMSYFFDDRNKEFMLSLCDGFVIVSVLIG
jgi:hypothetical protein